ncbi:hypothetical protein Lalb_Chr25g0289921 [Lupinus albus]|uniref:Uncharacterized protein n=1 Tax=Lupinus albus TaxID=3870 RepID=A0A6A4N6K0_LUPAL|nr:hypothetical protein Lalb_Chr25g0289921 [Lupinus albus]
MCYVLCAMCYVLCAMCYVLCAMCYVLCAMCYVLCAMCYVLCAMCYVLCAMCYVKEVLLYFLLYNNFTNYYSALVKGIEFRDRYSEFKSLCCAAGMVKIYENNLTMQILIFKLDIQK